MPRFCIGRHHSPDRQDGARTDRVSILQTMELPSAQLDVTNEQAIQQIAKVPVTVPDTVNAQFLWPPILRAH